MFVGARAWCTIVQRPELARVITSKLAPRDAPPSELVRLLHCPACALEMERGRFGASSNIVIDVCTTHGIWLDAGEVVAIADHAALRAKVGANAARRATNAAEGGDSDASRAAAEGAAAMSLAAASARNAKVKRGGFLVLLALLALRVAFFFGRTPNHAPPEIGNAGESAASAATSLRSH
jgi:Zn-finger nucleic acid-binding protein